MQKYNRNSWKIKFAVLIATSILLLSCFQKSDESSHSLNPKIPTIYYGTLEPFASEAVYFLMTDRFVDGDSSNNQVEQGGKHPTYRQPIATEDGREAFVGYMGGDFKGILNNAEYIQQMGFTSIWLTPIVDQPDEAFSGGEPIEFGGAFKDGGKTGYHGYWGSNFFKEDEHLPSADLNFQQLTQQLLQKYQLKTVLDVVMNHGSPAFSMPQQQAKYGQLFDKNEKLVADHHNLSPEKLDANNPLHQFYNHQPDIMQLSDLDPDNPLVLDYFVAAYLQWIEQGASAFRIDTIKHMPHSFWKSFTDKIRQQHPGFFMFAESYSFEAEFIAQHTKAENGGVSVLDFPGREALLKVFENPHSDYADLTSYLFLENSPYKNVYELMTFYDNHDMSRMAASDQSFIDAHNWLFTSRGIPVIYYGSEIGFMRGTKEHAGNRNYFGDENIAVAKDHSIRKSLSKIANVRKNSIALQRGLQVNLQFSSDQAAFYRVYENEGVNQTALVLLNKSDQSFQFEVDKFLSAGNWKREFGGEILQIDLKGSLQATVGGHGVEVFTLGVANNNLLLKQKLDRMMEEGEEIGASTEGRGDRF